MRKTRGTLSRVLRRGAALALAGAVVWGLAGGAASSPVGAVLRGESLAAALLSWELPPLGAAGDAPTLWQQLVLEQVPCLSLAGTASPQALEAESPPPEEAAQGEQEEESAPPAPSAQASEDIVEQTLLPGTSSNYVSADGVYVYNYTDYALDLAALAAEGIPLTLAAEEPQVLIIHSHSTEAYTQDGSDVYGNDGSYRTTDTDYNMVRVGSEVARVLREAGLEVIHDTGLYDYPAYNGAYDRSAQAIQGWLARYPSIQVVLDLHRDALAASDGTLYKTAAQIDGEKAAQVMIVVGTDAGGAEHSGWRQNLTLAVALQSALNAAYPTLARPIALRSSRFNQQLTPGSLLVEVGSHGNTLQEALTAGRLFAQVAAQVLLPLVEE